MRHELKSRRKVLDESGLNDREDEPVELTPEGQRVEAEGDDGSHQKELEGEAKKQEWEELREVAAKLKRELIKKAFAEKRIPSEGEIREMAIWDGLVDSDHDRATIRNKAREQLLKLYGLLTDKVQHTTADYDKMLGRFMDRTEASEN
jgi:hypothetical protein